MLLLHQRIRNQHNRTLENVPMNFYSHFIYVANTWRTELTGDGKGPSTFLTSGEEDVDRAFPCLVPVSVKDRERATETATASYVMILFSEPHLASQLFLLSTGFDW